VAWLWWLVCVVEQALTLVRCGGCRVQYHRRAEGRMSLSAEQEADCQEAFTLFDRGGAGKLAVAELSGVLRALGHNLAGDELSVTGCLLHTA
jgi:hypothetical protein